MPVQQLHHHTYSAGCVTTLCKSFQKSECVIVGSVNAIKKCITYDGDPHTLQVLGS
jgi:hypothetical protein